MCVCVYLLQFLSISPCTILGELTLVKKPVKMSGSPIFSIKVQLNKPTLTTAAERDCSLFYSRADATLLLKL